MDLVKYFIAGEIGNPDPPQCRKGYSGVALTLIDCLSTLAIIGNKTEFEKGVWWLAEEVRQGVVAWLCNLLCGTMQSCQQFIMRSTVPSQTIFAPNSVQRVSQSAQLSMHVVQHITRVLHVE